MNVHEETAGTSHNKRKGGSVLQRYLMMEMLQAFDQNRPSCPSRRRLSTSVALELFDDGSKRVSSVLRRPACALPHDAKQMRIRPLGLLVGFPLAQRWRQYCQRKGKKTTASPKGKRHRPPSWRQKEYETKQPTIPL